MTSTPPDDRSNANQETPRAAAGAPAGSESPAQPHDGFFKKIFSDPAHAAAELRAILPARVARHIDWDSLQAVHASFVDAALNQRHGDLLFSARLVEGHEVYLWLLFEHQSTIERWMPLRLLKMIVEFLEGWRKEHPAALRLPAILPIVLYQGATPWTAPRTLAELYDLSDQALRDLRDFLVSLEFVLDDLRVTPDDELMARPLGDLARVALVVMKHVTSDHLLDLLARLRDEIVRLLATEQGRTGLWGILWSLNVSTRSSRGVPSSAIWARSWARSSQRPWKPTKKLSNGCGSRSTPAWPERRDARRKASRSCSASSRGALAPCPRLSLRASWMPAVRSSSAGATASSTLPRSTTSSPPPDAR